MEDVKVNTVFKQKRNLWLKSIMMIILALIMLVPFFVMLSTSLKNSLEVNSPVFKLLPAKLMFENYLIKKNQKKVLQNIILFIEKCFIL